MKFKVKPDSSGSYKRTQAEVRRDIDMMLTARSNNDVFTIASEQQFQNEVKRLQLMEANFEIRHKGRTKEIVRHGNTHKFTDISHAKGKGHHISRMVRRDVDEWLKENKIQPYPKNYKEQLFNLSAIEHVIGLPSVAIDISDCYWRTAYNLGYITEKTFISGKRKAEWKEGRNGAIGGLASSTIIQTYRNGKLTRGERGTKRIPPQKEYEYIRNHIIGTVYEMFYDLYLSLGANFYMFLTDCVFTDVDSLRQVEKFFTGMGYRHKHKPIEFTEVDRKNKIVRWYDFQAISKDGKDKRNKYYMYSEGQVLRGGILEGALGEKQKEIWIHEKDSQKREALKAMMMIGRGFPEGKQEP